MSTPKEFDYHQRAATTDYRENWDKVWGKKADTPAPTNEVQTK